MMVVSAAFMVATLCAGGCAAFQTGAIKDPQTAVFAIESDYKHALAIGAWYGALPSCAAPVHDAIFCSKADIVVKIGNAKDVAGPSLKAAQATVRNPAFDESTANKIILSAQAAVATLAVITGPLEALLGQAITAGKAQPLQSAVYYIGAMHDAPALATLGLAAILALLNSLLSFLPQGVAWYTQIKADRDKVKAIVDEGREPTPAEWDELNASIAGYEAQIDENTARARAELGQ